MFPPIYLIFGSTNSPTLITQPCIQILVGIICMCAVFIYSAESEGFRFMDVSIIPLPFGEVRGRIADDHQEVRKDPVTSCAPRLSPNHIN